MTVCSPGDLVRHHSTDGDSGDELERSQADNQVWNALVPYSEL